MLQTQLEVGVREQDPGRMRQAMEGLYPGVERLSRLVDNVLDFAAIERGAKRYQLRPDDLGAVVIASVESARSALEELGMEVVLENDATAAHISAIPVSRCRRSVA